MLLFGIWKVLRYLFFQSLNFSSDTSTPLSERSFLAWLKDDNSVLGLFKLISWLLKFSDVVFGTGTIIFELRLSKSE